MLRNILFLILLGGNLTAQQRFTILDSLTRRPVAFASVSTPASDFFLHAGEDGFFVIDGGQYPKVKITAIGYADKEVVLPKDSREVLLSPVSYVLREIKVASGKNEKIKIRRKKGKEVAFVMFENAQVFSGSEKNLHNSPSMVALKLKYGGSEDPERVLKSVKLKTGCTQPTTFNLRIYGVGEDGGPGEVLYHDNIICKAGKNQLSTRIDLSALKIYVPPAGFFVAVEWLVVESNRRSIKPDAELRMQQKEFVFYEPTLMGIEEKDSDDNWMLLAGSWKRNTRTSLLMDVEVGD